MRPYLPPNCDPDTIDCKLANSVRVKQRVVVATQLMLNATWNYYYFLPTFQSMRENMVEIFSQHGARPQSECVLHFLSEHFHPMVIYNQ